MSTMYHIWETLLDVSSVQMCTQDSAELEVTTQYISVEQMNMELQLKPRYDCMFFNNAHFAFHIMNIIKSCSFPHSMVEFLQKPHGKDLLPCEL